MSYALGILAAFILIVLVVRFSMSVTNRKTAEDFKKMRPDASSIHGPDERNP